MQCYGTSHLHYHPDTNVVIGKEAGDATNSGYYNIAIGDFVWVEKGV